MIRQIDNGNIFFSKCQTLVNPINTMGVMGKGLAFQFKNRYPTYFEDYKYKCSHGLIEVGKIDVYKENGLPWIVSFPTKQEWWFPSKIEYIESGLDDFVKNYIDLKIESIAFPALGCQNGGLHWSNVETIMIDKLSDLPIEIELYLPK